MSRSTISTFKPTARKYLENRLWPDGVTCPECKSKERITTRKDGFYRCLSMSSLKQRIVWNLLLVLEKHGFHAAAVDNGDECTPVTGKVAAMELLFDLDDAYLFVQHDNAIASRRQWIRFVFGNGIDVVSDYNATNFEHFEDVMDNFNAEDYA